MGAKVCKNCGADFHRYPNQKMWEFAKKKFCNRSCAAVFNNSVKPKRTVPCLYCGSPIRKSRRAKYCTKDCQNNFVHADLVKNWLSGENTGLNGLNIAKWLRQYLLSSRGGKCESCGWDKPHPLTGRSILEIEHTDGNWNNNRPDNLKLLCPNCHAMTPTYRSLNIGNGRYLRRLRTNERRNNLSF